MKTAQIPCNLFDDSAVEARDDEENCPGPLWARDRYSCSTGLRGRIETMSETLPNIAEYQMCFAIPYAIYMQHMWRYRSM